MDDQKIHMLRVLDETFHFYAADPPARRAVERGACGIPGCRMLTSDGRRCAWGRMVSEEWVGKLENCGTVHALGDFIDTGLPQHDPRFWKEEAIGLPIVFIHALQSLHDTTTSWDDDGPTPEGRDHYVRMRDLVIRGYYAEEYPSYEAGLLGVPMTETVSGT